MKNADMPAIPVECEIIDNSGSYTGFTKREEFAKAAMQGLLSNDSWLKNISDRTGSEVLTMACALKEITYKIADKMLEENQS